MDRISTAVPGSRRYIHRMAIRSSDVGSVGSHGVVGNLVLLSRSMGQSAISKKKSLGLFGAIMTFMAVSMYLIYVRCGKHILLAAGATLILYATSDGDLIGSILAGGLLALAVYFFYRPKRITAEGFQEEAEEESAESADVPEEAEDVPAIPTPPAAPAKKKKKAPA